MHYCIEISTGNNLTLSTEDKKRYEYATVDFVTLNTQSNPHSHTYTTNTQSDEKKGTKHITRSLSYWLHIFYALLGIRLEIGLYFASCHLEWN